MYCSSLLIIKRENPKNNNKPLKTKEGPNTDDNFQCTNASSIITVVQRNLIFNAYYFLTYLLTSIFLVTTQRCLIISLLKLLL